MGGHGSPQSSSLGSEEPPIIDNLKGKGASNTSCNTMFVRFSGSGWLLSFHVGVGKFIQDHLIVEDERLRFGGESGGSLVCATLATGMDVSAVYEESLKMYEPCKNLPFRMGGLLKKALQKLGPGDEVWKNATDKMVIGLSRLEMRGIKPSWHAERVTEFSGRDQAISVLRASCHLPGVSGLKGLPAEVYKDGKLVSKHSYFDGGLGETYPCMRPADFGSDKVYNINVCAWGNKGEGYHICPGFNVPLGWFFFPANPGCLLKLYRLGYLRTAEMFCRVPPEFTEGLWRNEEFGPSHLPAIQQKIDEVIEDLIADDPFCVSHLLGFRASASKPREPTPEELDPKSGVLSLPLINVDGRCSESFAVLPRSGSGSATGDNGDGDGGGERASRASRASRPAGAAASAIRAAEALGSASVMTPGALVPQGLPQPSGYPAAAPDGAARPRLPKIAVAASGANSPGGQLSPHAAVAAAMAADCATPGKGSSKSLLKAALRAAHLDHQQHVHPGGGDRTDGSGEEGESRRPSSTRSTRSAQSVRSTGSVALLSPQPFHSHSHLSRNSSFLSTNKVAPAPAPAPTPQVPGPGLEQPTE